MYAPDCPYDTLASQQSQYTYRRLTARRLGWRRVKPLHVPLGGLCTGLCRCYWPGPNDAL